jgi:hypothetical protein
MYVSYTYAAVRWHLALLLQPTSIAGGLYVTADQNHQMHSLAAHLLVSAST